MVRIPIKTKANQLLKRLRGPKQLQDRFDERYQETGIDPQNTEGYLVPIIQIPDGASESNKNELFITLGNRRQTLPNSTPISFVGSHISPDDQGSWNLGNFKNFWNRLFVRQLTIRKTSTGPQLTFDYEDWLINIAHKLFGANIVLEGYGAHDIHTGRNLGTIAIERPVFRDENGNEFTWRSDRSYTQIDRWSFWTWYSYTDINDVGIGIMRDCLDEASPMDPGVEAEIDDTGNDQFVYVRFRNFLPNRVVVGIRIIA